MADVRRAVYRQRRTFLLLVPVTAVVAVVLGVVILGVRLADNVRVTYAVLGLIAAAAFVLAILCARLGRRLPSTVVLELDLARPPAEISDSSPIAQLAGGPKDPTIHEIVEALDRAKSDKRVAGLFASITFDRVALAHVQELRDAVMAFRDAGKFTVAYSDSYGSNGAYCLASAFDEVLLQPGGDVGLVGLAAEQPFVKRALDKVGVAFNGDGRHEYKNAVNMFTETAFTPPHREQTARLVESMQGQLVDAIATSRGMTPDGVKGLVDQGPFLDHEAAAAGLVDRLCYRDEAVESVKERAGKDASLLWLSNYRKARRRPSGKGRPSTVALVVGHGTISRGKGSTNPLRAGRGIAGDKLSEAIRKARNDKRVKAILLRVDSPGGDAVASETIWRETVLAREAGKPVVVSMGSVAASGGYYISCSADAIVAQPGTITGSIGVVSGKAVASGLMDKVGVDTDEVHEGLHALMFSSARPFSDSEWQRLGAALDHIYDSFTQKVAEGRNLPLEQVQTVARGRVWTGEDAKSHGLVDELGGYATALQSVRSAAGLADDAPVKLQLFPKKSALGSLRQRKGESSDDLKAAFAHALDALQPLARLTDRLGLFDRPGALWMGSDLEDWRLR